MNQLLRNHPTGESPQHVIMLLLGETKRQYADIQSATHPRIFPDDAEVWTCNAGFRIWRHDLLFVMDDLALESHKWPGYGADLAMHDVPILTSAVYTGYYDLHLYPFREVCEALGLVGLDRYFFNSVPYMLAYAVAIGVKKITLFGADYDHPNNPGREPDRANAEWWLGFARGRGVAVELASDTTLMRAREQGKPLYGYRFDPRISMDRAIRLEKAEEEEDTADAESVSVAYGAPIPSEDDVLSPNAQAFVEASEAPNHAPIRGALGAVQRPDKGL